MTVAVTVTVPPRAAVTKCRASGGRHSAFRHRASGPAAGTGSLTSQAAAAAAARGGRRACAYHVRRVIMIIMICPAGEDDQ